jgi:hypothetical protein
MAIQSRSTSAFKLVLVSNVMPQLGDGSDPLHAPL